MILVAFDLLPALAAGTEEISSAPQTTPWGKLCYIYLQGTFCGPETEWRFVS